MLSETASGITLANTVFPLFQFSTCNRKVSPKTLFWGLALEVKLYFGAWPQKHKIWLNQQQMAELFATSKPNISMHIANILKEKELVESSVVKNFLTTDADDLKMLEDLERRIVEQENTDKE